MVTIFRRVSILLALIACLAASSSPAAAQATCKGVKVNDFPAAVCCSASKGTGCVRNAEDCKLLEGTAKSSDAACNKGFPGYSGRVARAPEVDCSRFKMDAAWIADKGFNKTGGRECTKHYTCGLRPGTSLTSPVSSACKAAFMPLTSLVTGTCTDSKCSDCRAGLPPDKCTVSLVKK